MVEVKEARKHIYKQIPCDPVSEIPSLNMIITKCAAKSRNKKKHSKDRR
jgi:hypothetical protein